MTAEALRPLRLVGAALVLGGLVIALTPRHALLVVELVLVTIAAGVCLYALASNVPPTGWISPFKWLSPFGGERRAERRLHGADQIRGIRAKLGGRRQRLEGAPPMPPEVLRMLQPVMSSALDVDLEDRPAVEATRARLSPHAWAILATEPLPRSYWLTTVRPNAWEVAAVVADVLAEIHHVPTAPKEPS